eukprot:NODE_126_length_2684_cov_10.495256_g102_i0.p1 GENE.NODE_126_length_2684_cov_10.495256_g102_i0~~NODE_126_length_2684_cov_10.495256_g102_i0.p1  ORF type:complete len:864 (-),score=260.19 NODE_126_length_2684_cov_10.495256_g102_i0:92-2635(-)
MTMYEFAEIQRHLARHVGGEAAATALDELELAQDFADIDGLGKGEITKEQFRAAVPTLLVKHKMRTRSQAVKASHQTGKKATKDVKPVLRGTPFLDHIRAKLRNVSGVTQMLNSSSALEQAARVIKNMADKGHKGYLKPDDFHEIAVQFAMDLKQPDPTSAESAETYKALDEKNTGKLGVPAVKGELRSFLILKREALRMKDNKRLAAWAARQEKANALKEHVKKVGAARQDAAKGKTIGDVFASAKAQLGSPAGVSGLLADPKQLETVAGKIFQAANVMNEPSLTLFEYAAILKTMASTLGGLAPKEDAVLASFLSASGDAVDGTLSLQQFLPEFRNFLALLRVALNRRAAYAAAQQRRAKAKSSPKKASPKLKKSASTGKTPLIAVEKTKREKEPPEAKKSMSQLPLPSPRDARGDSSNPGSRRGSAADGPGSRRNSVLPSTLLRNNDYIWNQLGVPTHLFSIMVNKPSLEKLIQEIFNAADRKKTGQINECEFGLLISAFAAELNKPIPNEDDIEDRFLEFDRARKQGSLTVKDMNSEIRTFLGDLKKMYLKQMSVAERKMTEKEVQKRQNIKREADKAKKSYNAKHVADMSQCLDHILGMTTKDQVTHVLTNDDVRTVKCLEVFKKLDPLKRNELTLFEYGILSTTMTKALGYDAPSEEEVMDAYLTLDADGGGTLDSEELVNDIVSFLALYKLTLPEKASSQEEKNKKKKKNSGQNAKKAAEKKQREANTRNSAPFFTDVLAKLPDGPAVDVVTKDPSELSVVAETLFKSIMAGAEADGISREQFHEYRCQMAYVLSEEPPTDAEILDGWKNIDVDKCGLLDPVEFLAEVRCFLNYLKFTFV